MSRKLFGTDGIRGKAGAYPITNEIAAKLGRAAVEYFSQNKKQPKIIIGKDTRASGNSLESFLVAGIKSKGGRPISIGVIPTPGVAYLAKTLDVTAGIMISASHNPYQDNGLKIIGADGYKLPDEVEEELEKIILADNFSIDSLDTKPVKPDVENQHRQKYIDFVKKSAGDISLAGLRIALDCANGAAYQIAPSIFEDLGAEIVVMANQPDGRNINDNCGSEHPGELQKLVKENNCVIGIAFDGDADRLIVCDEQGQEVSGDHILAICGLDLLARGELVKNAVVATEYSNTGLDDLLAENGGRVVRVLNGDRYIIEEMRKNGYILGGERSGHIAFGKLATTGDGIGSALQLLAIMKKQSRPLSEMARVLIEYPRALINVPVKEKKDLAELEQTSDVIRQAEEKLQGCGRVLVRYSGTEDLARVLVEGKDEKLVQELAEQIVKAWQEEAGK